MLPSSIVRHRPVRDYSCCVLDSAFCFRDSSLPAPFVMPSRRNIFNPAEAYVMTLGDGQSKKRVIQLLNQISRFFGAADLNARARIMHESLPQSAASCCRPADTRERHAERTPAGSPAEMQGVGCFEKTVYSQCMTA